MEAKGANQNQFYPIDCTHRFCSMTNDGYFFYFVELNCRKVYKYDECFNLITVISTPKNYSCICYDWNENCFWAASRTYHKQIYKLNLNFAEIGSVAVKSKETMGCKIVGITCNADSDYLTVAFNNLVLEINKCCADNYRKLQMNPSTFFFSLFPYQTSYATSKTENSNQYFCIYSNSGLKQFECLVDCRYFIDDGVIPFSCNPAERNNTLYLMLSKIDRTQCLLKLSLQFYEGNSLLNFCEMRTAPGAQEEAIQSLAMMEASISRILNCEGEKMEKILEKIDDPKILIELNESVNHTILNVIQLEEILKSGFPALDNDCNT